MPSDQQARLKTEVRTLIEQKGWSIKFAAERAGVGNSTLYNWFNGGDELGELSVIKLSKVLGGEIEQLFYNRPHEAPATSEAETAKARAIREFEQLLDSVDDPAEQLKIINITRSTLRSAVDEYSRGAGEAATPGGTAPRAAGGRAGRPRGRPGKGIAQRGGA